MLFVVAGLLLSAIASAAAQTTLRVGDQKGNSQAVMEAAGVLKDVPYKIEWKEFPAARAAAGSARARARSKPVWSAMRRSPLPRPPTCRSRRSRAIRQSREGLAVLVPKRVADPELRRFEGQEDRDRPRFDRASAAFWRRSESKGWSPSDVQIVFLAPSDAKVALYARFGRCLVDLGALCQPGRSAVPVAAGHHGRRD